MELEELDDTWIKEIDEEEKIYNKFYTSAPNYVNVYIVYLNNENSIVHIKTSTISLNDSILSKNKLVYYISKYSYFHKKHYRCIDMLTYNIDVNSKQITNFIENTTTNTLSSTNYLKQVDKINDIYWKNSVEILHSINSLYMFYKPTVKSSNRKKTKKNKPRISDETIGSNKNNNNKNKNKNKKTRKTT